MGQGGEHHVPISESADSGAGAVQRCSYRTDRLLLPARRVRLRVPASRSTTSCLEFMRPAGRCLSTRILRLPGGYPWMRPRPNDARRFPWAATERRRSSGLPARFSVRCTPALSSGRTFSWMAAPWSRPYETPVSMHSAEFAKTRIFDTKSAIGAGNFGVGSAVCCTLPRA